MVLAGEVDLLLYPRWIVPIVPTNTVWEDKAIVVHAGKIAAILPASEAAALCATQQLLPKQTVRLAEQVVMPGLINSHAHSPMTLFRGMADDLTLMDWLNHHIWPAEKRWMDEAFMKEGTELALLEMLRSGTTCFNENYFFCDVTAEVALEAGVRAVIGTEVINFPTKYAGDMAEYLRKMTVFCEKWANHALIKPTIHPQGPYTVDDDSFRYVKAYADEHNLIIHLHLHETEEEIQGSLAQYGKRPVQRLYDLGLFSERLVCVHMCHLTDAEIDMIRATGAHIVHSPKSNLKLASGFCPVKKLLDAGVNVALGTDGAASNNSLDMFSEMQTAAILAKAVSQCPTALTAPEVLQMGTLSGAKAFGISQAVGSLEVGKYADFIAIDLSAINTQPIYHPISHLAYAVNSRQVTDVWVAGKRLLQQGELTTLDQDKILAKARQWQKRISEFA